jgi:HK97 family phage portal protein
MKSPFRWPLRRRGGDVARVESKAGGYGFVALERQGSASWTRRDYAALAREGYLRNPIVYRTVRLIAEACGAAPLLLYRAVEELGRHPLTDLLRAPNARQSGAAFLEALVTQLLLSGNAYVELVGEGDALELHLLRPERVTVETDADGWPMALGYRTGAVKRRIGLAVDMGGVARALHMTLFHPLDDHYGFAPLEAAATATDIHNAASAWNKALIDNSARPSGALVYAPKEGGTLSPDQFDRIKGELADNYQGANQAGKPLLLEGGLDWKPMGLSPKDMDFLEAKNAAAREIALAFGVPPMLIGIPGDNTYANYSEANRAFYRLTVLPMLGRLLLALGNWLGPVWGEELRLTFDADGMEGLALDRAALWERVGRAEFLSDDEKREAVGYGVLPADG